METLFTPEGLISLATLTLMEIVLGIDNIIFISIMASKLPEAQQSRARIIGLALALVFRILLLLGITWIIGLSEPLFSVFDYSVTARDLIMMTGGLFLIAKSTTEIHERIGSKETEKRESGSTITLQAVLVQIVILDAVFSIDSILTAIGLVKEVSIMIIAVTISIGVMMLAANPIGNFVNKNPTIKILALAFLLLIGFMLMVEGLPDGLAIEMPKGYIYFAIFFSLVVEMINIRVRSRAK